MSNNCLFTSKNFNFYLLVKNNLKAFAIHRPQNFHVGIAGNNTADDFCSLDIKFKSDGDDKFDFPNFQIKTGGKQFLVDRLNV